MATITEDYVSFEVAKLLEEKGFEIDTNKDYWKIGSDGTKYFMCSIGVYTSDINNKYAYYRPADSYPCPTQAMDDEWQCWCPSCGETVYVDLKYDYYQTTDNGDKEYSVCCPECGQAFYTAEFYD